MSEFLRLLMLFAGAQFAAATMNPLGQCKNECCMQPVTPCNYPASNLSFKFGSLTGFNPATGQILGFIQNDQVVELLESSACECCCDEGIKETLYIKFRASPQFVPALAHVLIITAKSRLFFSKLVDLYAIYFRTPQPLPALQMIPITSPKSNSLLIVFPPTYDVLNQTLVLDYTTVASSSNVVVDPSLADFDVTLGSELFTLPNNKYSGVLGLDALSNPATQKFENYKEHPERSFLACEDLLELIKKECKKPSALTCDDLDKIRCCFRRDYICARLAMKCVRVSKAGKCQKSKKACLIRHFTFITCCLKVLHGLEKKSTCGRLQKACADSDDPHGVFCAIIAILSRSACSISLDLRILIETMFEIVIGYNPYCNLAKTRREFYGLSEKDDKIVKGYSDEVDAEGSKQTEDEKKSEDEKRKEAEKRGGFFGRHRIAIIVTVIVIVTVVAIGGVVYAM